MLLDNANAKMIADAFNNKYPHVEYVGSTGQSVRFGLYTSPAKDEGLDVLIRDNSDTFGRIREVDVLSVTKIKKQETI